MHPTPPFPPNAQNPGAPNQPHPRPWVEQVPNSAYYPTYNPAQYLPPQAQPYVVPPRVFNHGGHIIADVLTFGLWVPFHILMWALHPKRAVVVYPDGRRVKQ